MQPLEITLLVILLSFPVLLILFIVQRIKIAKLKKQIGSNNLLPTTQSLCNDTEHFIETTSYTPMFRFRSAKKFKAKWEEIKLQQKTLKAENKATYSEVEWVVGLDKKADRDGQTMMKSISNIILLAFDEECDALIRDITFRNFDAFKDKITKSFERLNKQGAIYRIFISNEYLELKYKELHVAFEYERKVQLEKEEQQRIRDEMREQLKVEREAQREQRKAEEKRKEAQKEIAYYQKMLELDKSNKELQRQLQEAIAREQQAIEDAKRAISQAQLTKKGTVYVISNIGSFGENIYKIGMTRRLEPMDRIRELGDASVPFPFDVHALIQTDDAPKLEWTLHKKFADKQVNRVNAKKEFFEVELSEIAKAAEKLGADVEFTMVADASEYRQSIAMKKKNQYNEIDESGADDEIEDLDDEQ